MASKETPKTINAPDWDNPPGTDELKKAEQDYGSFPTDLNGLAKLASEADTALAEKNVLPEGKNLVVIKTSSFRYIAYYTTDHAGNKVPYFQHTAELKQSSATYKPVMRVLYSAVILKPTLEFVTGKEAAAAFYGELQNALRYLKLPNSWLFSSGDAVLPGTHVGEELLYAGNNVQDCQTDAERDAYRIITKLKQWQERLNANSDLAGEQKNPVMAEYLSGLLKLLEGLPRPSENDAGFQEGCRQIEKHIGDKNQFIDTLRYCQSEYKCHNEHTHRAIEMVAEAIRVGTFPYPALWMELANAEFISELRRWIQEDSASPKAKTQSMTVFTFNPGQSLYLGQDLNLPSGEAVEILQKLVASCGNTVEYKILDLQSNPSIASHSLKRNIGLIKIALKKKKVPYCIEVKRGNGYLLRPKS